MLPFGYRVSLFWVVAVAVAPTAAFGQGGATDAGRWRIQTSRLTGQATFVAAADGQVLQHADPRTGVAAVPDQFLLANGAVFGVQAPRQQLRLGRVEVDHLGGRHTHFHQQHRGVTVFSGVLKVHQNAQGAVVAANGDFYPIKPGLRTTPTLTAEAAATAARDALLPLGSLEPVVIGNELVIVDPGWYGDPPIGPHLAYHPVVADAVTGFEHGLFIDAHTGEVLDLWPMTCTALVRSIRDAAGTPELPGPVARAEGEPPVADSDVNAIYDYVGDTYAYFQYAFNRDGIDDAGMTIIATANIGLDGCPNAFWNFNYEWAAFCTGTAADDVVAHELTHGITQYTANLIYQNQSGQLNESFSDVFGELVDLFNSGAAFAGQPEGPPVWSAHPTGPGLDTPNNLRQTCSHKTAFIDGVRWLFAEDADGWDDVLRDMWSPPCRQHPDRGYSPLQTCNLGDSGGVHSGSGVPNHAFAMLCDGKSFNGYDIAAIGPIKAGAVWYRTLSVYLTPAADFEDAYPAFNQAAADLVGTYPTDPRTGLPSDDPFTAFDAAQVDSALRAVEMDGPGSCGWTVAILDPAAPPQCSQPELLFTEDVEGGGAGWTVFNSAPPTPFDWQVTTGPLPADRPGAAWYCPDPNLGDCTTDGIQETGIHSLVSPSIALPADLHLPRLAFDHYVETERGWDGGQVLLRVNGGLWQTVPMAAFLHNSYNYTLFAADRGNTNPNESQPAFTGADGQWGRSLVDLSTFVSGGDVLEVRFDLSKDQCFGITGWFVDDIEVYHCPMSEDCNGNAIADELDLAAGPHRDRLVFQPPNHSSGYPSDLDNGYLGPTAMADSFLLLDTRSIGQIRIWGGYYPDSLAPPDDFTVHFHADDGGLPGEVVATRAGVSSTRLATGEIFLSSDSEEWEYTLTLDPPVELVPGVYFIEVLNDTTGSTDTFIWQRATVGHFYGSAGAFEAPGVTWLPSPRTNLSLELFGPLVGADCNLNAVPDECDLSGDHTGDGYVDWDDAAALVNCLTGPGQESTAVCRCLLDADGDGDLDLADSAALQRTFGSAQP